MTGRKDAPTTYDQMMAEIDCDEADCMVAKTDAKSTQAQSDRTIQAKNPAMDQADGAKGDSFSNDRPRRRHSSFPPVQRRSSSRRSSHHDQDSDDASDEEKEARVRHRGGGEFDGRAESLVPGPSCTAAAADRVEINAMRSFLTRPPKLAAPIVKCFIQRDRHGLNRLHPVYRLYLEDSEQFLLCAQKRNSSKTSNYLLTMDASPSVRRSGLVVAKLRANWSGSDYIIFDNGLSPAKTAIEANVRNVLGLVEFAYDEMGPGRLNVRIPFVQDSSSLVQWKDPGLDKDTGARRAFDRSVEPSTILLRNKRPQYDAKAGGHVLDFQGRVTMPSIKNFQMQSDAHGTDMVLQFGRVSCPPSGPRHQCKCHKDTFTMDFRHPLSPIQAFAICLATVDTKVADSKVFESVAKLLKRK